MDNHEYIIEVNDDEVWRSPLGGLAHIAFDSVALTENRATLVLVWTGPTVAFDPVLHSRRRVLKHKPADTPCPQDGEQCRYRRSKAEEFRLTFRPTALRCEVLEPPDRCGFLLRDGMLGGSHWDYSLCIPKANNCMSATQGED